MNRPRAVEEAPLPSTEDRPVGPSRGSNSPQRPNKSLHVTHIQEQIQWHENSLMPELEYERRAKRHETGRRIPHPPDSRAKGGAAKGAGEAGRDQSARIVLPATVIESGPTNGPLGRLIRSASERALPNRVLVGFGVSGSRLLVSWGHCRTFSNGFTRNLQNGGNFTLGCNCRDATVLRQEPAQRARLENPRRGPAQRAR